jgi:hypothetical protein
MCGHLVGWNGERVSKKSNANNVLSLFSLDFFFFFFTFLKISIMFVKSTLVIGAVAATAVLGCQPPNCDRVDFGSCGNACCKVRVNHPSADPVEVKTVIEKLMLSGGPDSRYKMQPTAEAPNVDGFADLRPFNVTAQFQGLATHTTLSGTYTENVE